MTTKRQRWPTVAEWARVDSLKAAETATSTLAQARKNLETAEAVLRDDPELVLLALLRSQTRIVEAMAELERIRRLLSEARNGSGD